MTECYCVLRSMLRSYRSESGTRVMKFLFIIIIVKMKQNSVVHHLHLIPTQPRQQNFQIAYTLSVTTMTGTRRCTLLTFLGTLPTLSNVYELFRKQSRGPFLRTSRTYSLALFLQYAPVLSFVIIIKTVWDRRVNRITAFCVSIVVEWLWIALNLEGTARIILIFVFMFSAGIEGKSWKRMEVTHWGKETWRLQKPQCGIVWRP